MELGVELELGNYISYDKEFIGERLGLGLWTRVLSSL